MWCLSKNLPLGSSFVGWLLLIMGLGDDCDLTKTGVELG